MELRHSGAARSAAPGIHIRCRFDVALPVPTQTLVFMDPALAALGRNDQGRAHDSIFTYSKSPGLLSMPTLGGAIHEANWPGSLSGFIRLAMKSPSAVDGSHSPLRFCHV